MISEEKRAYNKEYALANKERIAARRRERYATEPEHREKLKKRSRSNYKGYSSLTEEQRKKNHEATRKWKLKNKDKVREYTKNYFRENRYGRGYSMRKEEYNSRLAEQNDACKICRSLDPGRKLRRFCIDHDHVTGVIRGLLCHYCNIALGAFKDNPEIMNRAIEYLAAS